MLLYSTVSIRDKVSSYSEMSEKTEKVVEFDVRAFIVE